MKEHGLTVTRLGTRKIGFAVMFGAFITLNMYIYVYTPLILILYIHIHVPYIIYTFATEAHVGCDLVFPVEGALPWSSHR